MVSWGRGKSVGTPQIVYMLETKSGEDKLDDVWASGRDCEWCSLNNSLVWCSEKKMTRNDEY